MGGSFGDVPLTYPHYTAIETILHYGISQGFSDGTYHPDEPLTRGAFAIFLARLLAGSDAAVPATGTVMGEKPFNCSAGGISQIPDVPPDSLFCRYVHYLAAAGVIQPTTGTLFENYDPAGLLNRQALAVMLGRALAFRDVYVPVQQSLSNGRAYNCQAGGSSHFTDIVPSDPLCRYANYLWAHEALDGVIQGATFSLQDSVSRGELARFFRSAIGYPLVPHNES